MVLSNIFKSKVNLIIRKSCQCLSRPLLNNRTLARLICDTLLRHYACCRPIMPGPDYVFTCIFICTFPTITYLSLPGAQGEPGVVGPQGNTGPAGPVGATGQQGERGIQGEQGATGLPGAVGQPGRVGAPGQRGARG